MAEPPRTRPSGAELSGARPPWSFREVGRPALHELRDREGRRLPSARRLGLAPPPLELRGEVPLPGPPPASGDFPGHMELPDCALPCLLPAISCSSLALCSSYQALCSAYLPCDHSYMASSRSYPAIEDSYILFCDSYQSPSCSC